MNNNPYSFYIKESQSVMKDLIARMNRCEDTKLFRNIAAVYIIWQHETMNLENAALEWSKS